MADVVKLYSSEELMAQSTQMSSLMSQYEDLFSQVKNSLSAINDSWSPNMAANFSGKISSAQNAFSNIVAMLGNGSSAARMVAAAFGQGNPGSILGALMGGIGGMSDLSGLVSWMNANPELMQKGADGMVGIMCQMTGVDLKTIQHATQKLAEGDYEGALKLVGEKGIKTLAKIAAGDTSELGVFKAINDATGGMLSPLDYIANFPQKVIGATIEETIAKGIEAYQKQDSDPIGALRALNEMGWNATFGGGQKAFSDALKAGVDMVANADKINSGNPVTNLLLKGVARMGKSAQEYYAEKGAKTGADMIGVAIGSVYEMFTGDTEGAEYYNHYYSDHGGIAGGMVDGMKNIASFAAEQLGKVNWKSALC